MKRVISLLFVFSISICLVACDSIPGLKKSIEIKEMREIAELATVECYFHNVAKSDREMNPQFYEFWKKKKMRFWVEYDGVVKIGIDVSKLKVEVEDTTVKITLPEAVVLDAKVDPNSLTADSFYYDPNAKKPDVEEQKVAFGEAQENMKLSAQSNYTLMANAQDNAKELLTNYVTSVGDAIDVEYTIEWNYPEDNTPKEEE